MRKNPHAVALGKLGGCVQSAAKSRAAKRNGKLGGRPKKIVIPRSIIEHERRLREMDEFYSR